MVRVHVLVEFSLTEAFQPPEKFLFIQALKSVIVHNLRSTGAVNQHMFFYLIPVHIQSMIVSKCVKVCTVSGVVLERHC